MKHNHNHHCQCDHERVKFCKTCKVVHCLDCNQEWRGYNFTYTNPWYYGQTLGGNVTTGYYQAGLNDNKGLLKAQSQNINQLDPQTTLTCSHTS